MGVANQIEGRSDSEKILFWLLLYIPGVSAGMAGLLSLVAKTINTNHDVMIITAVFGSVTLAMAVVVGLFVCCAVAERGASAFFLSTFASGFSAFAIALAGFGVLGAFYSDWILAAIAKNMTGTPTTDNAVFYWVYFVAKRLPFFSS